MKLSIIVPVYQAGKYLEKCIKSILDQTFTDFELILVDDGSNDGSEKICDDYAKKDARIKVIHQKNQGVSSARNAGMNCAEGDYIAFVDADDWIETDMFEQCMDAMEQHKVDIIYHGMTKGIWKADKKVSLQKNIPAVEGVLSKSKLRKYMLKQKEGVAVNCFSYLFSRKIADAVRFDITMPYSEDNMFVMQVLTNAKSYYFLQNCGYHYDARIGSAAYRWQPAMLECYQKTLKATRNFLQSLSFSEQEEQQVMAMRSVEGYASLIYNLCLPTCTLSLREKNKILKRARKAFNIDYYKKFYHMDQKNMFEKTKTVLTFLHLEGILIVLGPLYCKK